MSFSKFTKVGSLYRTTLKQGIASNATDIEFNDVPFANIQYPNWFVVEPNSSNFEIIYCPTAPTGAAFTGVVRGINPGADVDTGDVAYQKGHAANVEIVLAPIHRQWNSLVDVMEGANGTGTETFRIGKDEDDDITIYAQNADANKPFLRYDKTLNKWLISNDGVSTYDPSAGGSGLVAGLGITINASAIDLDLRTSGGLRNNQGVGSKQADVDPAIVARLDTANSWSAAQTMAAPLYVLAPSDPAEAAPKVYVDNLVKGSGTAGEAITTGQGLYLKASDGKLYKSVSTGDESTFAFIGIATSDAVLDATVTYAFPGSIVTGLTGLTAGSFYYVSSTAGTLSTTPDSTRYAKVGQAVSTTAMRVIEPKFIVSGTQTSSSVTTYTQTCGFYPARVTVRAATSGVGAQESGSSVGDDTNNCIISSPGYTSAAFYLSKAWSARNYAGSTNAGTISNKTATGFDLVCDTRAVNAQIQWTAFSE